MLKLAIVGLGLLAGTGMAMAQGEVTAGTDNAAADAAAPLVASWIAEDIGGAASAEGVTSYVKMTDTGTAQGQGGCNSFTGHYTVDGATLAIGPLASTRRACPPAQMDQEGKFFAALEASKGFRIEDDKLVLLDAAGATLMTLHKQPLKAGSLP